MRLSFVQPRQGRSIVARRFIAGFSRLLVMSRQPRLQGREIDLPLEKLDEVAHDLLRLFILPGKGGGNVRNLDDWLSQTHVI